MNAAFRLHHLYRNPYPITGLADAAFDDVADAQFPTNILDLDGLPLVVKCLVPSHDAQFTKSAELSDNVFGDPVGEVFLLRVS